MYPNAREAHMSTIAALLALMWLEDPPIDPDEKR